METSNNTFSETNTLDDLSISLKIKVIGIGGAGMNVLDRLDWTELSEIERCIVNTDFMELKRSKTENAVLVGKPVTRGLGAGGEVEVGKEAGEADRSLLESLVSGYDLIFLVVGLGGGTGSAIAPIMAEIAQEAGAMVICLATYPLSREGTRKVRNAESALAEMRSHSQVVITLPNDVLFQQVDENATVEDAFAVADQWMADAIKAIHSLIFQPGIMSIDFATLKATFGQPGGKTLFGIGSGTGEDAVELALRNLELCPLLHLAENKDIRRVESMVVQITGGADLTFNRLNDVLEYLGKQFGCKDSLVMGATLLEDRREFLSITVIGTSDRPLPRKSFDFNPNLTSGRVETMPLGNKEKSEPSVRTAQEELPFDQEPERGVFEKTNENIYNGDDLDVPTFIREGIRISLS